MYIEEVMELHAQEGPSGSNMLGKASRSGGLLEKTDHLLIVSWIFSSSLRWGVDKEDI